MTRREAEDLVSRFRLIAVGLRRDAQDLDRVADELQRRLEVDAEEEYDSSGR